MEERNYWQKAMERRLSRRRLLQTGAIAGAGLAAGLSLVGCTQNEQPAAPVKPGETSQPSQPKYGGILKFGYAQPPNNLDPTQSRLGSDPNWEFIPGDTLIYAGPDGLPEVESSLAESWKQEDDTTMLFKLREGVKFHDGTDFDAAATKYVLEYYLDANKAKVFGYRGLIEVIKTIEVVDKYNVRMKLSQPYPALLANLGSQAGVMFSPTAIEKMGGDWATKPQETGPFMVKSYVAGGEWVLAKNPNYWRKGLPYLDEIHVIEIPDDNVRAASLQSGNIDMGWFPTAGDVVTTLKKDPNIVASQALGGPAILTFNHALAPLDNFNIREALAHCLDKESVLKIVYGGFGEVAHGGLMPPGTWAYTDCSDVEYKFDIAKAKQLIKESGLPTPITLNIISADAPSDRVPMNQLIKGWLDEAGFQTTLEVYAEAECYRRYYDEGTKYHLYMTTAGLRVDPDGQFSIYVTAGSYWNPGRKSQDPAQLELNDLVKKAGAIYDQKQRAALYADIQKKQTKNIIGQIPICYRVSTCAFRKNVKGTDKGFWNAPMANVRPRFLWKE